MINTKELRQKNGWTQKQFSELIGVSVRTVQSWDQGIRSPDRRSIIAIECLMTNKEKISSYELGQLVEKKYASIVLIETIDLFLKYIPNRDVKDFLKEFEKKVSDITSY